MFYRLSRQALLLAALAGTALVLWPRSPASGQLAEPLPLPPGKLHVDYFGAASCSAMACHNFNGAKGSLRSEYSTWAGHDKHAKAYNVLFNDRSERIMRNLRGSGAPHASKEQLCLNCHATNDGRCDNAGERFSLSDGVSCEACHGPSHGYLTAHYKEGFKELPASVKFEKFGLLPTKDLVFRTKLCTTCHVGDSTKEVNHDLIAAGHPRLNFEMASYHGIYNKHWTDKAEHERHPDFYARIWLLGQLGTAKASVDLLVSRAEGSIVPAEKVGKPWPEFSEYACYACHKDIKVNSPRQQAGFGDRHPGAFPYGTWYLTALSPLNGPGGFVPAAADGSIAALKKAMQRPAPSATEVADLGKKLSGQLRSLVESTEKNARPLESDQIRAFLRTYVTNGLRPLNKNVIVEEAVGMTPAKTRPGVRVDEMDWDEATQMYLSMAALSQALSNCGAREAIAIRPDMLDIKARLQNAFPSGFDSPQGYNPLEKPKEGIRSLKEILESIRTLLGN